MLKPLKQLVLIGLLAITMLGMAACNTQAADKGLVQRIQAKSQQSVALLKQAAIAGKDVQSIVPKMKQVEKLGKSGKLNEAEALLNEILADFDALENGGSDNQGGYGFPTTNIFADDRVVKIIGYNSDAMEPFITRDGKYMFFNNEHDPKTKGKNMYYAERIDDYTFQFKGEVEGVNTGAVDGNPTMDKHGNFYYTCTENYGKGTFSTTCAGKFKNGAVTNVKKLDSISMGKMGWLNMDCEVNPNGDTLYSTQTLFQNGGWPKQSYFFYSKKINGEFVPQQDSERIFANINKHPVVYGISFTPDELEAVFTSHDDTGFKSYYSRRPNKNSPFGPPQQIPQITGFAEAPAFTDDGSKIYYHRKDAGNKTFIHVLHRQ